MKQAKVFLNNVTAGILTENDMGYEFRYDSDYLESLPCLRIYRIPIMTRSTQWRGGF